MARGAARRDFREYGEERYARRIARQIVRSRERAPIETTTELVDAIKRAIPTPGALRRRASRATRTFQAIRIAVNDELGSLERALPAAWELLRPGGRMAVISFHSLEDRQVKRFFADLARGCVCPPELPVCVCGHEPEAELVSRRALRPSEGEVADNPRAQSGRLRAAIKLAPHSGQGGQGSAGPEQDPGRLAQKGSGRDAAHGRTRTPQDRAAGRATTAGSLGRRGPRLRAPSPHRARCRAPRSGCSPTRAAQAVCTLRDSPVVDRLVRGRAGSRCWACC